LVDNYIIRNNLYKLNALTPYLNQEASAIKLAATRLIDKEVEKALMLLKVCYEDKGKLIVCGVGKSGIVARKISATFSSVGLMAINLNPLDALHGDLGIVAKQDVCIFLSNSGETSELLNILPHIEKRENFIISIVGDTKSSLADASYAVLNAEVNKEICPLNLAPTASTTVAMAIGDALAAEWINRRGISTNDFAFNHPAGSLGKQLTLTAKDLMLPVEKLVPLKKESNIKKIISQMTLDGIGVAWVENINEDGELIGLITDGDLRRILEKVEPNNWSSITAEKIMNTNPITIDKNLLAIDCLRLMEENPKKQITVLPVVKKIKGKSKFEGMLRLHDLVKAGLK